ncbi:type II toxin-antitoxin system RelB family antitoxin [Virgibacillus sp. W0181]|uniref:type II toxin-antitoxin system RelB family antitoxin n=1 Tax=Virgibacillus sp. W0181 TaxID=3391581 RepID=UPI003F48DD17
MDTITIRLNEEESQAFKEYAKLNNIPLSTLFKKTLEEKMEDEFDMHVIAEYENNDSHETYTHEELKENFGL